MIDLPGKRRQGKELARQGAVLADHLHVLHLAAEELQHLALGRRDVIQRARQDHRDAESYDLDLAANGLVLDFARRLQAALGGDRVGRSLSLGDAAQQPAAHCQAGQGRRPRFARHVDHDRELRAVR